MSQENAQGGLRDVLVGARVLPVLTVGEPGRAIALIRALAEGGLRVVEITLRSPKALATVEKVIRACPEVTVGVGTVLDGDQLRAAEGVGARFAVSPGLTADLVHAAWQGEIPWLPGVATVSEAMTAAAEGFPVQKLFPAAVLGGVALLKALRGPLPRLSFCPTGGIGAASYRDYLAQPNVLCVGGSWMVPTETVAAEDWPRITHLAKEITP